MSELVLVRHGETMWSASGWHTGVTDIPLTAAGEHQVSQLHPLLDRYCFGLVLTSPRVRARRTAELLGWASPEVEPDLAEWDYGGYEGQTTAEISAALGRPWRIWTDLVPAGATPGETVEQVAERADRVLVRVRPTLGAGRDVALVGHGHYLRVLAARWLGLEPQSGALLSLATGSVPGSATSTICR
ncbi:MAG TPA: histidine phosphatase family protein [Pseudonocardiaceae bacterium]|nr:histidine phosphatase family protein [Pseudonocardiaceae bacterium]